MVDELLRHTRCRRCRSPATGHDRVFEPNRETATRRSHWTAGTSADTMFEDPHDRGSATMLVIGAMLVLATATAVALAVGVVAAHRQKAATAADLAALAAAAETSDELPIACARAATVASANGGRLDACQARDGSVDVVTSVELPGALAGFGPLHARSRAGPWPPP